MTSLVTFTAILGGKRDGEESCSSLSAALTYGTVARLQLLRARQQEQIASETPGERAARLQRPRARQQERIASETPGERAARLQLLRARQQERIASETPRETAARRQRDRQAHSHRPHPASAQPFLCTDCL